jgi:methionyl-tRNA synthetase
LFDGIIPQGPSSEEIVHGLIEDAHALPKNVEILISELKIHQAIEAIMLLVQKANHSLEKAAPWKTAKTNLKAAGCELYIVTEALRIATVLLSPVMPEKTKTVLDILGAIGTDSKWGGLKPGMQLKEHEALFPRLEL